MLIPFADGTPIVPHLPPYAIRSQPPSPAMSRYASNQDVTHFFATHGIVVTHVRREGDLRHLRVQGQPLTLPMPASPEECLRIVREFAAQLETRDSPPPTAPE